MSPFSMELGSGVESTSIDIAQLENRINVLPLPPIQTSRRQFYDSLPLPESERAIRVLDLESPAESPSVDFQLTGRLRVVSLKTSPRISALSYVWGSFSRPTPDVLRVRLHDDAHIDLDITTNCADALKQLVSRFGSISIWVDAICINQDDDIEKASQILLMEEIYTWAKVYVWLGPQSDSSVRILERYSHLSDIGRTNHFLTLVAFASAPTSANRKEAANLLLHDILKRTLHERWVMGMNPTVTSVVLFFRVLFCPIWEVFSYLIKALLRRSFIDRHAKSCGMCSTKGIELRDDVDEILRRPWFRRGWTFQESALPMEITLLCGTDAIEWDMFVRGIIYDGYDLGGLESVKNFHDILTIWVCLPRKVSWNDRAIRRTIGHEDPTIKHYQSLGLKLLRGTTWGTCLLLIQMVASGKGSPLSFLFFALILVSLVSIPSLKFIAPAITVSLLLLKALIFYILLRCRGLSHEFLASISHFPRTGSHVEPLQGILYAIQTRNTSNPRDRVYASYAILSSLGVKLTAPNYSKEIGPIYQEHFTNLLHWDPGFLNLIIDVDSEPLPGSASWVPKWHTQAKPNWIGRPRLYKWEDGDKAAITVDTNEPTCLIVSGKLIGLSRQQMKPFPRFKLSENSLVDRQSSQLTKQEVEQLLNTALNFADWVHQVHLSATMRYTESIPYILLSVLCLDYEEDQVPKHIDMVDDVYCGCFGVAVAEGRFEHFYRRIRMIPVCVLESSKIGNPRQLFGSLFHQYIFPTQGEASTRNTSIEPQLYLLNKLISGKRNLFITENGLVGCGPERMRHDDHIFWISGVSVPMVLRPRSELEGENLGYTVIGPAFIYDCERPVDMSSQLRLY